MKMVIASVAAFVLVCGALPLSGCKGWSEKDGTCEAKDDCKCKEGCTCAHCGKSADHCECGKKK